MDIIRAHQLRTSPQNCVICLITIFCFSLAIVANTIYVCVCVYVLGVNFFYDGGRGLIVQFVKQ